MHIPIFPSKIWAKSTHYTWQNMIARLLTNLVRKSLLSTPFFSTFRAILTDKMCIFLPLMCRADSATT